MTVFGKAFVMIITAFSLVFLGVSTVVFVTKPDWTKKLADLKATLRTSEDKKKAAEQFKTDEEGKLKDTLSQADQPKKYYEPRIGAMKNDTDNLIGATTKARANFDETQATIKSILEEVQAKTGQILTLRAQVGQVEDQAKRFQVRQDEIKDDLIQTRRLLDAAKTNEAQIRQAK